MKGILIAAALAAGTIAHASEPGREVRVLIVNPGRIDRPAPTFAPGQSVPKPYVKVILFTQEPCSLKIEGAEAMHRAWQAQGAYQVGCWYPTLDGQYVVIDGMGNSYKSGAPLTFLPLGMLQPDQTVTIAQRRQAELAAPIERLEEHRNERP